MDYGLFGINLRCFENIAQSRPDQSEHETYSKFFFCSVFKTFKDNAKRSNPS